MSTCGWSRRGAGVLLAALICAVLAVSGLDSTASAQTGTDYDLDDDGLIEVASEAQLNAMRWDLDGNGAVGASANATDYAAAFPTPAQRMGCPAPRCTGYELAANISLSSNPDWEPIGNTTTNFTATFEGNAQSRTISNLSINSSADYAGLFGVTGTGSAIRNVKLTSVNVRGNDYVGALAGRTRGTIDNCETTGSVTGRWRVGGLIGLNDGTITASASSATVTSQSGGYAGGLVGENRAAIENSSASGSVRAPAWTGGLVGLSTGPIAGSTASGAVTATVTGSASRAGGLVGQNLATTIRNSHASGDVTASNTHVGGLVGSNYDEDAWNGSTTPRNAISGSTARGTVTTTGSFVGGLVGWSNGPISDSTALNPSVTGAHAVGGLVGSNNDQQADDSNTIDRSTATADVTGNASPQALNTGGLVSWNNGPVRDSYAGGAVQGESQMGGLVGTNDGGDVINSRASGAVGDSSLAGNMRGGLVGLNKGTVTGSVATGAVSGSSASVALGGLVGRNAGSISGSAATGVVSGGHQVGGLVGFAGTGGSVTESWAGGAVSASLDATASASGTYVGGLIGWNEGTVGASFATGDVTGAGSAGGLIGRSARTIIATYATGNVTGSVVPDCGTDLTCPSIGGLIGEANKGDPVVTHSNVQASYSTGSVSGTSMHLLGGLAGAAERSPSRPERNAVFTNSYWDTATSGQTLGVGSDDEDASGAIVAPETATPGATGQTTTALKEPTAYTGIFADWNVTITGVTARTGGPWDFGAATDYPVLRGLGAPPSFLAGTVTLSIGEERAAGTPIGSPLTASDADGDALTYKLVGAAAVFFSIDIMTGQLLTKTLLDYENPVDADRDNEYEFMVQAADGVTTAFQTVAVSVSDAIDNLSRPTIAGGATVAVAENSTAVATYRAQDPDGAGLWALAGGVPNVCPLVVGSGGSRGSDVDN